MTAYIHHRWSAVARGAAAKGLEGGINGVVSNRKCRRYYGTKCNPIFVDRKHKKEDAFISEYDGFKRARHQMDWLLKKGQDLPTSKAAHAKMSFRTGFWPTEIRQSKLTLMASDQDKGPKRSVDQVLTPASCNSFYANKKKGVYTVAQVTVDFSDVPADKFRLKRSPGGGLYHRLNYDVEISLQSSLEFSLTIDGVKYGSLTATYD